MARSRTIKPGFFLNEMLAECPPLARLLFAGLWCHADRAGRLEYRPKRIKAEILPYDDCDIEELLCALERHGFIQTYAADGERYIQIPTFLEHQNPHPKEPASKAPAAPRRDEKISSAACREITRQEMPSIPFPSPDSEGGVVSAPAREPPALAEGAAAVGVIQLFDEERVDAFGEEFRRAWPTSADSIFAARWLAAGASFELCRAVFREGFGRVKRRARPPPNSLSYFDKPIANALAEQKRPMAEGTANGTARTSTGGKLSPGDATFAGFAIAIGEADAAEQRQSTADRGQDCDAVEPLLDAERQPGGSRAHRGGLAH